MAEEHLRSDAAFMSLLEVVKDFNGTSRNDPHEQHLQPS